MFGSSLFHSLMRCEKKCFWSIQFCKEIHGKCCNVCENFFIHLLCWRYSSPNSWYNLSWDQSSMASVIANVALYCNDSLIHLILHWSFCVCLNWKVGQPLDTVTVGKRFLTTLFREDAFCSNFIVNFQYGEQNAKSLHFFLNILQNVRENLKYHLLKKQTKKIWIVK